VAWRLPRHLAAAVVLAKRTREHLTILLYQHLEVAAGPVHIPVAAHLSGRHLSPHETKLPSTRSHREFRCVCVVAAGVVLDGRSSKTLSLLFGVNRLGRPSVIRALSLASHRRPCGRDASVVAHSRSPQTLSLRRTETRQPQSQRLGAASPARGAESQGDRMTPPAATRGHRMSLLAALARGTGM
jgi:hypothetical protein